MRTVVLCLGLLGVMGSACGLEPPKSDLLPPAVWQISPRGDGVETSAFVEVVFTEPVHPMAQAEGQVALVDAASFDEDLIKALDDPPLSSRMRGRCVAGRLDFSLGGSGLRFTPEESLQPQTHYAVIVSAAVCDLEGNRLVDEIHIDGDGRQVGEAAHVVHWFMTR